MVFTNGNSSTKKALRHFRKALIFIGADDGIRTRNLLITIQLLYR
jgi:hypothetical protein